jgi:hypothetical protein
MRRLPLAVVLVILLAAPATAAAAPDLRISEHVVPATASTGEVVQARVTVTNVGDTPTEGTTEVGWQATNEEGFIMDEFVRRPPVCPPGTEDIGPGPGTSCYISTPIAAGASVTAVFSGSSRVAISLEARASVVGPGGTGLSDHDTKPLTITGPTLPEPPGPRISDLTLEDRRLRPGERAVLRFRLDRQAKVLHAGLWRCLGTTGCRRRKFVLLSGITRTGRQGRNTLRYPLPRRGFVNGAFAPLAPGRYRITVWAYEPFRRQIPQSVRLRVLPLR